MPYQAAIASQTPLLRYDDSHVEFVGSRSGTTLVRRLADHHISPGGVSRMVVQTIRAMQAQGWLSDAHWFSLQPNGPKDVHLEDVGIHAHHLQLPREELA